jgi:hypothetical protein
MKAEREAGISVNRRAGFVVSAKTGKRANEMTEEAWEKFQGELCDELKMDYPDLHGRLFAR